MTGHIHDQLAYYRSLTPDERRAVDAHLAECADCRATLAAYHRQDAGLAALPGRAPRRVWQRPAPLSLGRSAAAHLGDALAVAGLAALAWLGILQVQLTGGAALTPAALEPGLALPPTQLSLPSPWLPALPWLAAALLGVGGLFVGTRRSWWPTALGALAAGVLLTGFVPPFSAVPNPVGLYWRLAGGYSYDPRLPFRNDFLISGDPAQRLRPQLDKLIGARGLTPLDPSQPLARYEILRVSLHPAHNRVALVTTRFIYADGASRVYPVPVFDPAVDFGGIYLAGWRADGLERLGSQHLAFPGQPFAAAEAPVRLGPARRLDLAAEANRLDEIYPEHWRWSAVRLQRLAPAPDGSAVLLNEPQADGRRQLWLAPFNGAPPIAVGPAGNIGEYGWSPDAAYIIYTRFDPAAAAVNPARPFAVVSVPRPAAGLSERAYAEPVTLVTGLAGDQLPGLTAQGVWFFHNEALWLAPYAGGAPERMWAAEPGAASPRPAADGASVAYVCGRAVCLADSRGETRVLLTGLDPVEMVWSPDGERLAVVDRDLNNLRPVRLWVVSRSGAVSVNVEIAPRDAVDAPQWTLDGGALFVQTFPQDGRRLIVVDTASGQVLDLSQEHWDAYAALLPDGRTLLLNNGRGDFWLAELER